MITYVENITTRPGDFLFLTLLLEEEMWILIFFFVSHGKLMNLSSHDFE